MAHRATMVGDLRLPYRQFRMVLYHHRPCGHTPRGIVYHMASRPPDEHQSCGGVEGEIVNIDDFIKRRECIRYDTLSLF